MIDIQFIRENPELVKQKSQQKGIDVDIDQLLGFDKKRRELLLEVEAKRQQRNKLIEQSKGQKPSEKQVEEGKKLKDELANQEHQLSAIEKEYDELLRQVPNIFSADTPIGDESKNHQEKVIGEAKESKASDHLTWGEKKGYIDFERGAKVAGNKFYYTKGALVELELACVQFAMSVAIKHGFTPITVPHLVNTRTSSGTGFLPRGDEDQIYTIEGEDLNLIATAEVPITGYHADEILDRDKLPLLYAGISPAYRKEAGAYGKHSRGLYRVHQFNKVELYIFCEGDLKESEKWHQKLLDIEEEICQALEIPYRIVKIASGDLGAPAYKKFDIEYWSPVDGQYRELMSCSNVTDYQARRLNIRTKDNNQTKFVHSLNATAMPFSRTAIALIENHQTKEGDVIVPKALQPYMGRKEKI